MAHVEQVELATLEYVWWWNNQLLHGELDMRTPIEVEHAYYADLESAQPATAGQGTRIGTKPRPVQTVAQVLSAVLVEYIDGHRGRFGVEPICRVMKDAGMQIAPSTYAAKTRCELSALVAVS